MIKKNKKKSLGKRLKPSKNYGDYRSDDRFNYDGKIINSKMIISKIRKL